MMILAWIGFLVAVWWVSGVLMFTCTKVLVVPGTPWSARLQTVFVAGWVMPWLFLHYGKLPVGSMIHSIDPSEEEREIIRQFQEENCPCPKCRARRGEL